MLSDGAPPILCICGVCVLWLCYGVLNLLSYRPEEKRRVKIKDISRFDQNFNSSS